MQPRKPVGIHKLQGTRPHYKETPVVGIVSGRPKMPKDLTPEAEAEWKRLVKELSKRGTMTRVDSSVLEIYVRMWSRWRKVEALAEANPTTVVTWTDKNGEPHEKVIEHPASAMATRLENSLRNMLKELSATPASRDRTKAPPPPAPTEPTQDELILSREASAATPPTDYEEIDLSLIDENAVY
jgi:P27 family predicted phage terminase small subunit